MLSLMCLLVIGVGDYPPPPPGPPNLEVPPLRVVVNPPAPVVIRQEPVYYAPPVYYQPPVFYSGPAAPPPVYYPQQYQQCPNGLCPVSR